MAYVQKNNPVPKTGCGRRRLSGMKNPFKSKELKSVSKELKKASNTHAGQAEKIDKYLESSPAKLQERRSPKTGELIRGGIASDGSAYAVSRGPARKRKLKQGDAAKNRVEETRAKKKLVDKSTNSPMKGKLKPCQKAAAKRKFKVYPSAYANMWASNHKC